MEDLIFYKSEELIIRKMKPEDITGICCAGGDTSEGNENYLKNQLDNQAKGDCTALLALYENEIAGFVFLYYKCKWGGLRNQGIPSVVDLFVLQQFRKKCIGSKLMDVAECLASADNTKIYLDVCLNREYGVAQRFYIKRGYIPDGKGVYYEQEICPTDATCKNDDELTLCLVKDFIEIISEPMEI